MDKITLTGGTLMGDGHNHSHSHSHGHQQNHDPLAQPGQQQQEKRVVLTHEQQIELSKLVLRPQQNQQGGHQCQAHNHSHGHSHGHQNQNNSQQAQAMLRAAAQGGGIQVPASAMSLMIPLEEIVKGTPQEIMQALSTLLRLGQYEKWENLAKVLIEREKENPPSQDTLLNNNDSISSMMDDSSKQQKQQKQQTNNNSNTTWWLWIDNNGHTLLHWAAKRGDDKRFVEFFMNHAPKKVLTELLHTTSHDGTAMTPLHWACTEPGAQSLGILSLFMQNSGVNVNWEATDASGCTPLLIAAQYGQVEVCAYLLQKGRADLYAMDNSLDTALHWAAYKGTLPVCGLLFWYHEQRVEREGRYNSANDLMAPDQYGQTPLHLAALRGHTSVVRWLLHRTCPTKRDKLDLLYHKDNNGRTPLDLAIHKHRPTVQTVLQDAQDHLASFNVRERSQWQIWRRTLTKAAKQMTSWHAWKLWMGLSDFADEMDEAPQFPYYYLWAHGLIHILIWYPFVFCPVHQPSTGLLWDFPFWHLLNVMNFLICIITLQKTTFTNPGNLVVDEGSEKGLPKRHKQVVQYWRKLYETTLESYATTSDMQQAIKAQPLCHTCHIARPLRSKHCRVTRTCVLMFDHHCPFVGNTVGLYNYPYFYFFLASLAFLHVAFLFNLVMCLSRSPKIPWGWLLLGVFQGLHVIPTAGMFVYHTQLSVGNLTTNEHMNVAKYDYLVEKTGSTKRYRNPWFRSRLRNLMDRLTPTAELYTMPTQYQSQYPQSPAKSDDAEQQQSLLSRMDGVV
ncbi:protein phosphatase 6 regulatory ankyrin repeat subunit C [Seminavis robusta]|uniref:Palmitoyltransferase n=1 Tax=Seminavis robusta TaxID=568900 RepID=A0A9N8DQS6_9STRA|nr:protein phosphatase 6 regulatory ankyrin repeat subunit C [Seminavis robusta]|eukprot:Sro190_g081910.1 protein phosphatase 6 regulatory ankyrin repeat subunit C (785) ;mRNA; r:65927-68379